MAIFKNTKKTQININTYYLISVLLLLLLPPHADNNIWAQKTELSYDGENGLWGYIDKTGKVTIPYRWQDANSFSEDLASVKDTKRKQGFIDKTGKVVIPCKWRIALEFKEGLASVEESDAEWKYIDKTGKEIISCNGIIALPFSDGLASIWHNKGYFSCIDKTGEKAFLGDWRVINSFSDGLSCAMKKYGNDKYGYIDKTGKIIIPFKYNEADPFFDGLACVRNNRGKYGYIDKTGKIIIPFNFNKENIFFSDGLACIQDDTEKYGYIDKTGKIVIPCQWENAKSFSEGYAAVMTISPNAQYMLGQMYANGQGGVDKDETMANYWYEKSRRKRVALLIGNWDYPYYKKPLTSPRKDVEDMCEALMKLGFEKPVVARNYSKKEMEDAMVTFLKDANTAEVAVVFYSGHGVQFGKKNYLLPNDYKNNIYDYDNDSKIQSILNELCITGQDIIYKMDSIECKKKFLFLDACRDYSFDGSKGEHTDSFVKMKSNETCVFYATEKGTVAYEAGHEKNSFFTKALLDGLNEPNKKFDELCKFVQEEVKRQTRNKNVVQVPEVYGLEFVKDFIFNNKQ